MPRVDQLSELAFQLNAENSNPILKGIYYIRKYLEQFIGSDHSSFSTIKSFNFLDFLFQTGKD